MKTIRPVFRVRQQTDEAPFGLVGWLKEQRVHLPLKGVECRFSVRGGLLEAEMDQIYHQDNQAPLDCQYLFPLPADSAVHRCEIHVSGRVLIAKVLERKEAVKLVTRKKAAGHRTALVESERDNLFTLSLGNVQPGDLIIVRLTYLQPVRRLGNVVSVEIPLCPGVRYIPGRPLLRRSRGAGPVDDTDQVPDASRITTPRIDQLHPDAAYVNIEGVLDTAALKPGSLTSPSHSVTSQVAGATVCVNLHAKGEVPDRDFVLHWEEASVDRLHPRGWSHRHGVHTYALLELRAPAQANDAVPEPMDFYFMLDRSGSMQGLKWQKAIAALRASLERLHAADRVWLTVFESRFLDYDTEPVSPAKMLADDGLWKALATGTAGGTELVPALGHVLRKVTRFSGTRPASLLLITDAQVGNETEVLKVCAKNPGLPVHCFGIDNALNDSLLLALTRQQGGSFHSLNPRDDIAGIVSGLADVVRSPVLTNITLPDGWEVPEHAIASLHAGQVRYVSARRKGAAKTLTVAGKDGQGSQQSFEFTLDPVAEPGPYLLWCRRRIEQLLAQGKEAGAIKLSVESNLVCKATAFVAWDEQEKVAIATKALVQPAMEPALHASLCTSAVTTRFDKSELRRLRSDGEEPIASFQFQGLRHALEQGRGLHERVLEFLTRLAAALLPDDAGSRDRLVERLLKHLTLEALARFSERLESGLRRLRELDERHREATTRAESARGFLQSLCHSAEAKRIADEMESVRMETEQLVKEFLRGFQD